MTRAVPGCELCALDQGAAWSVVAGTERLAVVRVLDAPAFPAFYRVVWRAHVAEWTDLHADDRLHCMEAVAAVESALRAVLTPRKVNLASLGNMVAHLHWHVIARFEWDSHFPQPIWGAAQRTSDEARLATGRAALTAVDADICRRLAP
jgi:diadenosine tetraphosphate (Ap4A) HIT family hydrolase